MSKNPKKIRVEILNPVAGCGYTSLAHARRYVKRGRAEWANDAGVTKLRFVNAHHAHESARIRASAITRRGEGIGMASLEAVEGLPVAGPAIRVFTGHKPDVPIVDHSVIEISRRLLPVEAWF
jgi:hypothetical protein